MIVWLNVIIYKLQEKDSFFLLKRIFLIRFLLGSIGQAAKNSIQFK